MSIGTSDARRLILDIATEIMRELGPYHSESVYQNAMHKQILKRGLACDKEVTIPIMYDGDLVGTCRADLVLDTHVIELKKCSNRAAERAQTQVGKYVQLLHDLQGGDKREGICLNFNPHTSAVEHSVFVEGKYVENCRDEGIFEYDGCEDTDDRCAKRTRRPSPTPLAAVSDPF